MRCKHKNGALVEVMEATHSRKVRNGTLDNFGYNEIENITHYEYTCDDCGKMWKYFASPKKLSWLRKIHEQLADN